MAFTKTIASAVLAIVLLSLARGEGQGWCKMVLGKSYVAVRKDSGSVTCVGQKWHIQCAGLCNSQATVEMQDGAVHWKQDCKCCQPTGHESKVVQIPMKCTDGSTESISMPFVIPQSCQCTDC